MKHRISITLVAISVAAMLTFTSCKKEQPGSNTGQGWKQ